MIIVRASNLIGKGVLITEDYQEAINWISMLMGSSTEIEVRIETMDGRVRGEGVDCEPGAPDALPHRSTLGGGMETCFQDADDGAEDTQAGQD